MTSGGRKLTMKPGFAIKQKEMIKIEVEHGATGKRIRGY